ncbi:hypothetical protein ASE14_02370 [Agromyces sp. Root81]|uniref:hypothetical protein n=1 Tax=Agromyces sp. Root81 TaxID=1736601 RepID=UPI0006FE7240|nr:hypothetical protein [Agromyces sp. Root81]KRC62689.1 hypothetical protein ASE14_02370 [Agromyces sp. Root81]
MDSPPPGVSAPKGPAQLGRAQSTFVWLAIVSCSVGGLLVAADLAFSSQPERVYSVYAYSLSKLDEEPRAQPIVELLSDSSRDIRLIWQPAAGAAAMAWNSTTATPPPEGCERVISPEPPAFAEKMIRLGPEQYDALDCGEFIVVDRSGETYAWTDAGER